MSYKKQWVSSASMKEWRKVKEEQEKMVMWGVRSGGCHLQRWFVSSEKGKYKLCFTRQGYWPRTGVGISGDQLQEQERKQNKTKPNHLSFHFQNSSNTKGASITHIKSQVLKNIKYQFSKLIHIYRNPKIKTIFETFSVSASSHQ